MFATAGYFKGIICPFFEHGLCHRPHCHYRHSKSTAVGVFRSSLSTNITGSSSLKCQKDELTYKESGCHDNKGIQPTSNKQDEKISDLFSDTTPTKDTSETTIKDIFGSSSDDDSDNNIHSPTVAMTTPDSDIHEDNSAIEIEFHKATTSSYMPKIDEGTDEVGRVNNEGGTSGIKVGGVERGRSSIGTPYENKGIKRKRIAHPNNEVPRGPLEGSLRSKPKSLSDQKLLETLTDPNAIYSGKRRTARSYTNTTSPTTSTNAPSLSVPKRPVLPLVMNAKVPTKIRQRFLDSFIDEYIRKGMEPQTAYDQSLEDERELYTRSTSRMIYMNICSHKLKKLQKEVNALLTEKRQISDVKAGAHVEGKETPKKKELPLETGVPNVGGIKHAETSVTSNVKNSKKHKLFSKTISVGGDKDSITSLDGVSIHNDRDKMELDTTHFEPVPNCPSLTDDFISLANPSMSLFTLSSSHESPSITVSQFYTNRKETVSGGGDQDGCGQSNHKAKSKKKRVKNTSSFEDMLATADSTKIKKRKIKPALNLTINSRNIPSVCGDSSSKDSTCQTSSDIVDLTNDDLSHTHLSNTASSDVIKDETMPTFMEETTLSIVSVESATPNLGVANTEFDNVGASEGIDSWQVFDKDLATPTFPPPPDSSSLINLTDLAQKVRAKRERNQKPPVKRKKIRSQKIAIPTTKPSFSIIKKKEPEFNAIIFYDQLLGYLLSEEQLTTNRYPRPSDQVGVTLINVERQLELLPEPLPGNAVRHYCCRCQKPFIIYNNGSYQTVEECVYHYGKLYKSREYGEGVVSQYSCCGERRDSSGCQVATMHVTAGEQPSLQGGYTKSTPPPSDESYVPDVFAVDCEMCYTTVGLELTRVTLINLNLETVYESIVRPSHPIVDYNTRFSGLTAEDFTSVTTSLSDVHSTLLSLVYEDTILIGHSLDSDLRAMKYIHSAVVDTAIVFPHQKGPPFKRALKSLMSDYLQKIIQDSVDGGHDSREDAIACMELMIWKIKSDLKKTKRRQL